jgi:hypothetical protein
MEDKAGRMYTRQIGQSISKARASFSSCSVNVMSRLLVASKQVSSWKGLATGTLIPDRYVISLCATAYCLINALRKVLGVYSVEYSSAGSLGLR